MKLTTEQIVEKFGKAAAEAVTAYEVVDLPAPNGGCQDGGEEDDSEISGRDEPPHEL